MDLEILEHVFELAKFKNLGVKRESSGNLVYPGWTNEYEDYWSGPKKEFMGQSFAPFKHNYAYGWSVREMIIQAYRAMNEDATSKKIVEDVLKEMDATVGGHDTTAHFVVYVQKGGTHLALLYRAFQFNTIGEKVCVYLLNMWLTGQAAKLEEYNAISLIVAPLSVAVQLYALGWRRTLALWGTGVIVSEGMSSLLTYPFSGWSVITYMIYGQMWNETFEDRKLRTVAGGVQNLRGLAINGLGGYGAYQLLSNLYYDPAPFLEKSQKTQVHHGAHHLGMAAGFLLNRWLR